MKILATGIGRRWTAGGPESAASMGREPPTHMARILIVDDSATELRQLAQMLERHGHHVLAASTGREGVSLANSEQPDLVLMDVVMPEVNGFQATRQIAREEHTSHIPVIIVSAKDQAADRVWGERQGAKGYLTKPVKEGDLMAAVNQVLGS